MRLISRLRNLTHHQPLPNLTMAKKKSKKNTVLGRLMQLAQLPTLKNPHLIKIWSWLKRQLRRLAFGLGTAVLIFFLFAFLSILFGDDDTVTLEDNTVLMVNVDAHISKSVKVNPVDLLTGGTVPLSLEEALLSLQHAAKNPDIVGVVARIGNAADIGYGGISELREVIKELEDAGKFTIAFNDSYGLETDGNHSYYLASAFNEVWMQPSGTWAMLGFGFETLFYKNVFETVGLDAQYIQREEYKNFAEMFTNDAFSAPAKENITSLLTSISDHVVADIANDMDLETNTLTSLINTAPHGSLAVRKKSAVTQRGYWPNVIESVKNDLAIDEDDGEKLNTISLTRYSRNIAKPLDAKAAADDHIGVVSLRGPILRALPPEAGKFGDVDVISGLDASELLNSMVDDDAIKAVIIRVDSPGGSYAASDMVYDAIKRLRLKNKPVITVMGDSAASGGYLIAMAGTTIVAQPATVTGSIGVVGGKINAQDVIAKIGLQTDGVTLHDNTDLFSLIKPFSPTQLEKLNTLMDETYTSFLNKVVASRGLVHISEARKVAKGQVFSGLQAYDNGLVDELGGFLHAVEVVQHILHASQIAAADKDQTDGKVDLEAANLPRDDLALVMYPRQAQDPLSTLLQSFIAQQSFAIPVLSSILDTHVGQQLLETLLIQTNGPVQTYSPVTLNR